MQAQICYGEDDRIINVTHSAAHTFEQHDSCLVVVPCGDHERCSSFGVEDPAANVLKRVVTTFGDGGLQVETHAQYADIWIGPLDATNSAVNYVNHLSRVNPCEKVYRLHNMLKLSQLPYAYLCRDRMIATFVRPGMSVIYYHGTALHDQETSEDAGAMMPKVEGHEDYEVHEVLVSRLIEYCLGDHGELFVVHGSSGNRQKDPLVVTHHSPTKCTSMYDYDLVTGHSRKRLSPYTLFKQDTEYEGNVDTFVCLNSVLARNALQIKDTCSEFSVLIVQSSRELDNYLTTKGFVRVYFMAMTRYGVWFNTSDANHFGRLRELYASTHPLQSVSPSRPVVELQTKLLCSSEVSGDADEPTNANTNPGDLEDKAKTASVPETVHETETAHDAGQGDTVATHATTGEEGSGARPLKRNVLKLTVGSGIGSSICAMVTSLVRVRTRDVSNEKDRQHMSPNLEIDFTEASEPVKSLFANFIDVSKYGEEVTVLWKRKARRAAGASPNSDHGVIDMMDEFVKGKNVYHECTALDEEAFKFLWQLNDKGRELLEAAPTPDICLNLRRGDKVTLEPHLACVQVSEYVAQLEKRFELEDASVIDMFKIWHTCDDYTTFEELREQRPTWDIETYCEPTERGYFLADLNKKSARVVKSHVTKFLRELFVIQNAKMFIGTRSTSVGFIARLLRASEENTVLL